MRFPSHRVVGKFLDVRCFLDVRVWRVVCEPCVHMLNEAVNKETNERTKPVMRWLLNDINWVTSCTVYEDNIKTEQNTVSSEREHRILWLNDRNGLTKWSHSNSADRARTLSVPKMILVPHIYRHFDKNHKHNFSLSFGEWTWIFIVLRWQWHVLRCSVVILWYIWWTSSSQCRPQFAHLWLAWGWTIMCV